LKRGITGKIFVLTNHLGNVLVTISDRKIGVDANTDGTIDYYTADVITATDYYPFGMDMPGRKFGADGRYGFNGKERDKDINSLTAYDYGFRIYNPAIGKFLSVDPLTNSYPWYTPYQFAGNMPIWAIDLDGLEEKKATIISVVRILDVRGNLIKEPTSVEYGATGSTILATPSARTVRQGDADGDIIENRTDYQQVEGIKFTITDYSVHKSFNPVPPTTNNTVQINDNDNNDITPPTTRKEDVITWRTGTRTTATEITNTNTYDKTIGVKFQGVTSSNLGTGIIDEANTKAQISSYAAELKSNGVTSINLNVQVGYRNWDTKPGNSSYNDASELFEARGVVLTRLFAAHGITIKMMNPDYDERYGMNNSPLNVSASASKATTTVTGYNVTTTPVKQKLVNGKPNGGAIPAGKSTTTTSATKPKTGTTF
jgi:RHS repeat-associated protein